MKLNISDQEEASFQMAPMIDMVFLLLVFFMCASHLNQQKNKKLNLPIAEHAVITKNKPHRWIVNIDTDGKIFKGRNTPITIPEMIADVKEAKKKIPDIKIYIRADANTHHKYVRKVMNALAHIGIGDFIFGVYEPQGSEKRKMK